MPTIAVQLHSFFFKLALKHRLQALTRFSPSDNRNHLFGVTSRPGDTVATSNPSFSDGVATKDIHIDPLSSLTLRIFLPETVTLSKALNSDSSHGVYGGYSPNSIVLNRSNRRLPVILQFHGGGFVGGSCDSVANDGFCRRIAKMCDAIVVAVGYRLAPENRFPAAFDDALKVLNWLARQASLAECRKSVGRRRNSGFQGQIFDGFGASMAEPWVTAHGDLSRCVLLGASSGANIANYVARKYVEAGNLLDPVKVVAQVLMYPFFIGTVPTPSEKNLASSYFYDKPTCIQAWKLFLPKEEFSLDHPAANPLTHANKPPLKDMPPTLTVIAEHDWMRDRAIAYSEELRKVNVDAPVLDYKDTVHEFATLDVLFQKAHAVACMEDITIWVKKYISLRGHEFSY